MTDATELDEAAIRRAAERSLNTGDWWDPRDLREALDRIADVGDDTRADAEYVWQVRPVKVLAVLDEITRLRAALDEVRAEVGRREGMFRRCLESENRAQADLAAAESALAAIRTLARSWSGRHDLLMTGASAAHDIEAALATPTTTERSEG